MMLKVTDIRPFFQRVQAAQLAQKASGRLALPPENPCRVVARRPAHAQPSPSSAEPTRAEAQVRSPQLSQNTSEAAVSSTTQTTPAKLTFTQKSASTSASSRKTTNAKKSKNAKKAKKAKKPSATKARASARANQAPVRPAVTQDSIKPAAARLTQSVTRPKLPVHKPTAALREPRMAPAVLAFGPTKVKRNAAAPGRMSLDVPPAPAPEPTPAVRTPKPALQAILLQRGAAARPEWKNVKFELGPLVRTHAFKQVKPEVPSLAAAVEAQPLDEVQNFSVHALVQAPVSHETRHMQPVIGRTPSLWKRISSDFYSFVYAIQSITMTLASSLYTVLSRWIRRLK